MTNATYTREELRTFLFRSDAIAPIFIADIPRLEICKEASNLDAWMVGTIPSRMFRITGTLMHTTFWDNEQNWRTVYAVDDGTGCLEVNDHERKADFWAKRYGRPLKPQPQSAKAPRDQPIQPSTMEQTEATQYMENKKTLQHLAVVRLVIQIRDAPMGRVANLVNKEVLQSAQQEVDHWNQVMQLHNTLYVRPFAMPTHPPPPVTSAPESPQKPFVAVKTRETSQPPKPPPPKYVSPVKEHLKTDSSRTLLSLPPAKVSSGDLSFDTFKKYLSFFIRHDPLLSESPSATSVEGFTYEYIHRVPDLRYLSRRIILKETRRMTREYLLKRKERAALEQNDTNRPAGSSRLRTEKLMKPAPLTEDSIRRKVNEMFLRGLRELVSDGQVIVGEGACVPIPPEMADPPGRLTQGYPECLGPFRLWASPPPLAQSSAADRTGSSVGISLLSIPASTGRSLSSKRNNWREGLEEHDGPEDRLRPLPPSYNGKTASEVFYLVSPQLIKGAVLKVLKMLKTRKEKGQIGGGSPAQILAALHRDDQWRRISTRDVEQAIAVLVQEDKIWSYDKDMWTIL
ncbi:hypothetical protein DL93DRAFT_2172274 [Clavulina sp. PMI_390]|nr:hypothetical protein DL93DRAFT_2172274 [Clavulina sp. PMI_390]